MALKQKEKVINGVTYKVTTMDAFKALRIQTKLIKLLGSNIFELIHKTKESGFDMSLIAPIMDNFDDALAYDIITTLLERGIFKVKEVDGKKIDLKVEIETDFAGRAMDLWALAGFVLEVNFAMGE